MNNDSSNITDDDVVIVDAVDLTVPSHVRYKHLVESFLMPSVSLFGLFGNCLSIHILGQREVKLKRDFVQVLCSLASFDILLLLCTFLLFSLPAISPSYSETVFPFTVPYLYPATNTVMTCSIYMTAAVGVNRYLDIVGLRRCPRLKSGYSQAALVLAAAAAVNVPRWFEFEYHWITLPLNDTHNHTIVRARATDLRLDDAYVRDYTLIASSTLIVFVPIACMLVSTMLISRELVRATTTGGGGGGDNNNVNTHHSVSASFLSDRQEQARRRRNRGVTLMLIGIIVLFIVCHVGEIFMSLYEMMDLLDGERRSFPSWAKNVVTTNHLLLVINSSLNFVIYCRDVVFRRCLLMIYRAWHWRKIAAETFGLTGNGGLIGNGATNGGGNGGGNGGNGCNVSCHSAAMQQLRSLNDDFGINLHGDASPEVILRDLDPQSMILCGLSGTAATAGVTATAVAITTTITINGGGTLGGIKASENAV